MWRVLFVILVIAIFASGLHQEHHEEGVGESSEEDYMNSTSKSIEYMSPDQHNNENPTPEFGICQIYTGKICERYMGNQSIFIVPGLTMEMLEGKLAAAAGVIKNSPDISTLCSRYAWYSLCATVLPICRTPEETNHHYFSNKNRAKGNSHRFVTKKTKKSNQKKQQQQTKGKTGAKSSTDTPIVITTTKSTTTTTTTPKTIDFYHNSNSYYEGEDNRRRKRFVDIQSIKNGYPPTKNTENLRRICRTDCELLENEICQKEYAIAKRHPTIGQILSLEDCMDLEDEEDCLSMGINIDIKPDDTCYWDNGAGYRGIKDRSINNRPCLKWSKVMREITHIELTGNNYCRNVDHTQRQPWCYVDKQKTVELCDIPKCADRMWFLIICGLVTFLTLTLCFTLVVCCKKMRKQGVSNIQNMTLPNVDKNIYGNSAHSPQIEMTSLLNQNNSGNAPQVPPHRGSVLKIPQYILGDVKFVEELGEGAFGKVYKGELFQKNGERVAVAVKALKENASAKTQQDFRREIELISDLKHQNIVNILGVVLKEEPLCMLFEYMPHGDLHEFLISNAPSEGKYLTQQQFLFIALQIAEGMEYLSSHHYIHRDLAARNCLVGEELVVKISDFGLSRDIYSSDYYRVQSKSLLPIRWMSSEAILYGKFTTESDVWSYGVVLWEIYSYGVQPYFGFSNPEVINMVRARQLLPCPEACPSAAFTLMVECWHEQPVRRPTFAEIVHRLKLWYQSQRRRDQMDMNFGSMQRNHSITTGTGSTISVRSFK